MLPVFYFAGFYAFRLCGINERIGVFTAHFLRLLAGMQVITTAFAIATAGTHTFMLFVPVLLIAVLLLRKQLAYREPGNYPAYAPESVPKTYIWFFLAGSSALYFIWWWGSITHFGEGLYLPFWDHFFYSRISEILVTKGIEAKKIAALFEDDYRQVVPYHYTELWISALFTKVFGIPHLVAYELLTIPLLQVIMALAVLSVAERYIKVSPWILVFSALAVFYFGIGVVYWYSNLSLRWPGIFNLPEYLSLNVYPKQLVIYMFFGLGLVLFINGYRLLALVALLLAGIGYSVVIPAVFGGTGLYCALMVWPRKQHRYLWVIGIIGFVTAGIGLFYAVLNPSKEVNTISKYLFLYPNPIIHLKGLVQQALNFSLSFTDVLLLVSIVGGIAGWKRIISYLPRFSVFIFIVLFGYLATAATFGFVDCFQFFKLTVSTVLFFAGLGCWLWVFRKLSLPNAQTWKLRAVQALFIVIIGFNLHNVMHDYTYPWSRVNEPFMDKVTATLQKSKARPLGAFIDTANTTAMVTELRYLGTELLYYNSHNIVAGLSVFDDLAAGLGNDDNLMNFAKEDIFYRFTERQKKLGRFKNPHQSQIDFLKERKTDYLFMSGKVDLNKYPEIRAALNTPIYDTLNRNYFYLLDRSKLP
ncbi:MAG: hypothetical protein V4543_01600 [Bacteroidota bacterium]